MKRDHCCKGLWDSDVLFKICWMQHMVPYVEVAGVIPSGLGTATFP